MALQDVSQDARQPRIAVFNDPKIRGWVYQIVLLAVVIYLAVAGIQNMFANLRAQHIASGFDFLGYTSGFSISQSLIP
jgi:general L-amino acid transport system permease protein